MPNAEAHKDARWGVLVGVVSGCWTLRLDFPLCMRRAAQQGADLGGRCLSEASLGRPRSLRAAQVARSEAKGRRQRGRLFFGDFLLATQKKVTAQSGAHPDKAAHSTQDPSNPPRPPGRDPACPAGHRLRKALPQKALRKSFPEPATRWPYSKSECGSCCAPCAHRRSGRW